MIVEKIHNKRLKKQGISICSKYKSNDTILERNTDKTKRNDNIQNGICLEKDYYSVPIIALTANSIAGDKERYLEEGMDDYLSKPLEF